MGFWSCRESESIVQAARSVDEIPAYATTNLLNEVPNKPARSARYTLWLVRKSLFSDKPFDGGETQYRLLGSHRKKEFQWVHRTFISGIRTIEGHLPRLPGLHPQLISHFVDFLENRICRCKCVVTLKDWGLQELVDCSLRYSVLNYPLCKSLFFLIVKGGPIVWLVELLV